MTPHLSGARTCQRIRPFLCIGALRDQERDDCLAFEAFAAAMRWPGSQAVRHRWETVAELPETYRTTYDEEKKAYAMAHVRVERCLKCSLLRRGPWFDQAGGARHNFSYAVAGVPGFRDILEPVCPVQLCWLKVQSA